MLVRKIEKEKRRADHLFYTSLKYTKTGDVILNLIKRWEAMIEECITGLLESAKKKKIIKAVPKAPLKRRQMILKLFKKVEDVERVIKLYTFFRNINSYRKISEHEFRKNLTLHVITGNNKVDIDIEKLQEWDLLFNNFVKFVDSYIRSKKKK